MRGTWGPRPRPEEARPIEILLVEDNPGDVRLIEEALREGRIANEVHVARDGEDGLAYLRQEGQHRSAPRPDLVLLDLNLPGLNGHELLARIKDDPQLEDIPVVILTSSDEEEDLRESYRLQAAGFVTKPMDPHEFLATVHDLGLYWVSVVKLPEDDAREPSPR